MVPVTGHAIGTRTGVNRDSNRLGTVATVQNSNISEWEMQRRDRIGHSRLRLTPSRTRRPGSRSRFSLYLDDT